MQSHLKAAIDKANSSAVFEDVNQQLGKLNYPQISEALIYVQTLNNPELIKIFLLQKFKIAPIIDTTESKEFITQMLKDKSFNAGADNQFAFLLAVEHGKTDIVKLFLDDEYQRIDPFAGNCRALREAVKGGYTDIVRLFLADKHKRADLNAKLTEALQDACANNHPEIVELLLKDGRADPRAQHSEALRIAVSRGYPKIVKLLLDDKRADPQGERGSSLLTEAVDKDAKEIVALLLNDERVDPTRSGNSPYELALQKKYFDIANTLIANPTVAFRVALNKGELEKAKSLLYQADPNADDYFAVYKAGKEGLTDILQGILKDKRLGKGLNFNLLLQNAVEAGHTDIVRLLLEDKRADPKANDSVVLRKAIMLGHIEIVRLLLEDGRADTQAKNCIAFTYACANAPFEIVTLLLADAKGYPQEIIDAAFIMAVKMNRVDIVKLLLDGKRADPTTKDSEALKIAAKNGNITIVQLLLDDGRINAKKPMNDALISACASGHKQIVDLLLQAGRAEPSANNSAALREAAKYGHVQIVRDFLKDNRAHPGALNNMAFLDALARGHVQVAQDLLSDNRVQLTSLQQRDAVRLAARNGYSEIFKLLINQKSSAIHMDQFIVDACNKLPEKVFPLEADYKPHNPVQAPTLGPIRVIANNDKYIDENVKVVENKGKPLVHKDGKTPIGYNIHFPPDGVEIKNVLVQVYAGHQSKDRAQNVYKPGYVGTFEKNLLKEGTVVITLNLPDLLENNVPQAQMSEKLYNKIHDCIDHFHKTLTTNPQSLHNDLAPLKDKPTYLYGASFGGLMATSHATHFPGTFSGYIAHNGALDMRLDRLGREFKPHLIAARKEQMNKIKDPILLLGTEADNNVFIKMIFSFYNQLTEEQKRDLVRLGITPKGNLGKDVNKGHFIPDDAEEFELYLQRVQLFMNQGPSQLPEFSDLIGYEQELLANKYAKKGTLKDRFIAEALMIKDLKKHRHNASIEKAWETDYQPIFNAFWVANECTQTELYYNGEILRLVQGNLLTDEVILNFIKSQAQLLKQLFEDNHFPVSAELDLAQILNDQKILNIIREQITKPQQPFNKSKQEYLLFSLYKANPSLLKTHEQRLTNIKDYTEELSVAKKEFKEKATQVHKRSKALWHGVVLKSSPQTAAYFERTRQKAKHDRLKAFREATVSKLKAAITLFNFDPHIQFFNENNELETEKFIAALSTKKTENISYLTVTATWSEWWHATQGGDKSLLESMRSFYIECDSLLNNVSTQSMLVLQRYPNADLNDDQKEALRSDLILLEKQFMGVQILKEELKAGIKANIQDQARFKNIDRDWDAAFAKTSEECRKVFYENRNKLSLLLEQNTKPSLGI